MSNVLSFSLAFVLDSFPPFYRALLTAWRSVEGSWSPSRASFVFASSSSFHVAPVGEISAQSVYRFLLSESRLSPHCIFKFFPVYSQLYWPSTWSQPYLFSVDHPVLDLSWKVAHGVLYTADRLLGFSYSVDPLCFCGLALECPSHLFFSCPLAQSVLSWLQSLLFSFSSLCLCIVCGHVLFQMSSILPPLFLFICYRISSPISRSQL